MDVRKEPADAHEAGAAQQPFLTDYLPAFAALTVTYWAAGVLGLQFSLLPGAGTAIWPAAGIAFAGLVLGGARLWPAIFAGRLLIAVTVGSPQPLWADALIALGTSLGALLPVRFLEARQLFEPALARMMDVVWLAVAAASGALISASFGAAALWLAGAAPDRLGEVALNWWFGFAVGVLVVAPLILSWAARRTAPMPASRWLHLAAALGAVAFVAGIVFVPPASPYLRVWHILPAFIWVALAFQVRGVSIALALASALAIWAALHGTGPIAVADIGVAEQLLLTQEFMAVTGLTILFLGAAVDERRDMESQARLAAIVSSSPDAMISYAPDGRLQSWNAGAQRLFGYSEEEALKGTSELLLPPEPPEGRGAVFRRALAGETVEVESRRVGKDGEEIEVAITASQMRARDGTVLGVAAVMRDIGERKRAEGHQRLLINELNHRVKNMLAIVQAIAQQSFAPERSVGDARAAFEGRLGALSTAHDVLTRENWEAASMRRIVDDALAPYQGDRPRFAIDGPDLRIPPKTAVSLALACHELATNAVKYGALSNGSGRVDINWRVEPGEGGGERLHLVWEETGGPPVEPPARRGFGTRLIERSLAAEFEGEVRIDFRKEGVVCTVDATLPEAGR